MNQLFDKILSQDFENGTFLHNISLSSSHALSPLTLFPS
jgi:hypothetical protein